MKKITTITSFRCEKDICNADDCAKCFIEHSKTEQVPETFEELKELCKDLKCNKSDLDNVIWFEFPKPKDTKIWLGKFLCMDIKGQVGIVEKTFDNDVSITIFATGRTSQQMWNIIKSLME